MAATERRLSEEEFARRGDEIYETRIRPELTAEDEGKFVAVDIESGSFELDVDELEACDKLNQAREGRIPLRVRAPRGQQREVEAVVRVLPCQ